MAPGVLAQQAQVSEAVATLEESVPALIATLGDVMRDIGEYCASVSGHGNKLPG
jgi:hypothetical protein